MKLFDSAIIILIAVFLCVGCKKDKQIELSQLEKVNEFIHESMSTNYYWADQMPELSSHEHTDSKAYFDKLLYSSIDKWSFITSDYQGLVDYFNGVRKEYGYSVRPALISEGSSDWIGFIEFVYPNTPASRANLKRGDIIIEVNGHSLNKNTYAELFDNESISLTLGTMKSGVAEPLDQPIVLSPEEIHINPILKTHVQDRDGHIIAYLAYTSFISSLSADLESLFAEFKEQGVQDLILDLRYNGGGSVATAKLLASMIGPSSIADEVFIRSSYNNTVSDYLATKYPDDESIFIDRFLKHPNNLSLQNLYVLTTSSTASASEMLIYALAPYMNVVQIGEKTHGKYYGSITINDPDSDHGWAIQPIVMKAENVNNSIDYSIGLSPQIQMYDSFYAELGADDDPFMNAAFNLINNSGEDNEVFKSSSSKMQYISMPKPYEHPLENKMYLSLP
ncbi:S41 family peptidase [Saccharicrinis aurantiacus]|uniref:S41 family peptidase n=1 Tax=Saccharicrinis aurantiacus TaxID=1849719 RepID=UPI002490C6C7|nr:S41 family peptidase [Saccharicrinis aurantiacus]